MALRYILCFNLHSFLYHTFQVNQWNEEINIFSHPTFTIAVTVLEPVRFYLLPCTPRTIYKYYTWKQKFVLYNLWRKQHIIMWNDAKHAPFLFSISADIESHLISHCVFVLRFFMFIALLWDCMYFFSYKTGKKKIPSPPMLILVIILSNLFKLNLTYHCFAWSAVKHSSLMEWPDWSL